MIRYNRKSGVLRKEKIFTTEDTGVHRGKPRYEIFKNEI